MVCYGNLEESDLAKGDAKIVMKLPAEAVTQEVKERFLDLASTVGGDLALYCFCAVFDLPVNLSKPVHTWEDYCERLEGAKQDYTFEDGVTDIYKLLERGQSEMDRWLMEWGEGDPDHPYSTKDYKILDSIFRTYSSRLEAAGGMDAQQEDTLRHCSRMALLRDKNIAKGTKESVEKAAKLDKMIQDNLGSENLRKKDAKPIEAAKVDGIIDAMQKKFGLGAEMTKDQFMSAFHKWAKSHHYPETLDAAEHCMMAIINTTRANNDLPELTDVPQVVSDLKFYETEFASEPNDIEEEAYEYLHIERGDSKGN